MEAGAARQGPGEVTEPVEPAPPVQNRFLFVDIAAQRAKQLRRGARSRLEPTPSDPAPAAGVVHRSEAPHKPERVAMEEVRRGLVQYELPQVKSQNREAER